MGYSTRALNYNCYPFSYKVFTRVFHAILYSGKKAVNPWLLIQREYFSKVS